MSKVRTYRMSNLKRCDFHPEKKLGYMAWHAYAEEQTRKGVKQKQCPTCRHWFFPDEYGIKQTQLAAAKKGK